MVPDCESMELKGLSFRARDKEKDIDSAGNLG